MPLYPLDASPALTEAAPKWLAGHQQYIQANTLKGYPITRLETPPRSRWNFLVLNKSSAPLSSGERTYDC